MIHKMDSGGYMVTGLAIPQERVAAILGEDNAIGVAGVLVSGRELDQLITAEADRLLKRAIELQRHALLPDQKG